MLRVVSLAILVAMLLVGPVAVAGDLEPGADSLTGRVWSLRPAAGSSAPDKYSGDAATIVRAILSENQDALGLSAGLPDLELDSDETGRGGYRHLRFRQVHQGVPVLGEVAVHLTPAGALQVATVEVARELPASVVPGLSAADASELAIDRVAITAAPELVLIADEPELLILPLDLVFRRSTPESRLAWKLRVAEDDCCGHPRLSEVVYLDALTGEVLLSYSGIRHAVQQYVADCSKDDPPYDCSRDFDWYWDPPGVWYTHGRSFEEPERGCFPEGAGTIFDGSFDVDTNYTQLAQVHDLVFQAFGIDGANNQGGTSTQWPFATLTQVHYDGANPGPCPSAFFWPDTGNMGFCLGMSVPDVVSHEYGHAIYLNQGAPNPLYQGETGAIEEAHSDVFGEYGEDYISGSKDWLSGYYSSYGTFRDLTDPHQLTSPTTGLPYPNRYFDTNFYCGGGDNGGVHINSTVVGHAFYFFSEGGEHNGCEMAGQGIEAAVQVFYEAMSQYFNYNTNFNQSYSLFLDACASLYDQDIVDQLAFALQAVEIDQPGGWCSGNPEAAPPCAVAHGGEIATTNDAGQPVSVYGIGQEVWLSVTGATVDREFDVYLLAHDPERTTWTSLIGSALDETPVTVDGDGSLLAPVFVTAEEGQFDLVLDGNRDGHWQPWADELASFEASAVVAVQDSPVPPSTDLLQGIYPNPFNPRTDVYFFARPGDEVTVAVYDVAGRQVAVLHEGAARGGRQRVSWDATGVSSGVYLVQVARGTETMTEKVALLK
ncbi:T9SS type A sorting domain-containing protein [candidate division GN15 bacterium]|nr:T9SS type A sorting domain-containing protein [candidate division GN15 bacterium]